MLHLPAANSTIRNLFEVEQLASTRRQDVPFLRDATVAHRQTMNADKAIRSVNFVAASVDGTLNLYKVGNRGGAPRKLWNFGSITDLPN